jgi:hypothetical protein
MAVHAEITDEGEGNVQGEHEWPRSIVCTPQKAQRLPAPPPPYLGPQLGNSALWFKPRIGDLGIGAVGAFDDGRCRRHSLEHAVVLASKPSQRRREGNDSRECPVQFGPRRPLARVTTPRLPRAQRRAMPSAVVWVANALGHSTVGGTTGFGAGGHAPVRAKGIIPISTRGCGISSGISRLPATVITSSRTTGCRRASSVSIAAASNSPSGRSRDRSNASEISPRWELLSRG